MWIPVAIALALVFLPTAQAYVLVYSKGFDYRGDYGNGTYVISESAERIVSIWRSWGYENLQASDRIDPRADGIIILGCSEIDGEDVNLLREYVEKGGRLVLDLYCEGGGDEFVSSYGVTRSKPYRGEIQQRMRLPYVEIKGYPIDRPIIIENTPVNGKYVGMIYSGPEFNVVGDTFSDVFITPGGESIALIGRIGEGSAYITGCLLCSNQVLMANILDWASDGIIDFPKFRVDRRVYPPVRRVDRPFYDEIRISIPSEEKDTLDIAITYPYNKEGYCKMIPVQERIAEDGATIYRFEYTPREGMGCTLPPITISMSWVSREGKIIREFVVPGEYVQILAPNVSIPGASPPYALVFAVLALVAVIVAARYYKKRKIDGLKMQLRAMEESLEGLHRKLMTRQITEDVYKKLVERYVAEIEALKTKIRIMEGNKK